MVKLLVLLAGLSREAQRTAVTSGGTALGRRESILQFA